jgi:hypothetical protein
MIDFHCGPDLFELRLRMPEFECRHGRCFGDSTPPCGCWPEEEPGWKDERGE